MKLWIVDTWLLKRYYEIDKRVYLDEHYISKRPHVGVIFKTSSGIEYFAPICRPKEKDYDSAGKPKSSTLGIYRVLTKCGTKVLCRIQIMNMIPVSSKYYEVYDVRRHYQDDTSKHKQREILISKQMKQIIKQEAKIIKMASKFYKMKLSEIPNKQVSNAVSFKLLEAELSRIIFNNILVEK